MNTRFLLLMCFILCLAISLSAQEPEIEQIVEQNSDYSDISELLETLAQIEQNPIDLNRATAAQLTTLPWISTVLATAIINYRNKFGKFTEIEELTRVINFDPNLIPILQKYLTINTPPVKLKNISFATKTRVSRKLEKSVGLRDGSYYPSPAKIYNRFIMDLGNHLRLGVLLEKDSGEQSIDDLKIHFLSYRDRSNKNRFILGNYRLEFAQGLVFGNPYGYYKGNDPIYPAKRRGRNLVEYTLVDENASLYGISTQFCFEIYQFNLFLSSNQLDASINSDGTLKNFYTTGFHRTNSEINKKDRLMERLVGGRMSLNPVPYCSIGATYYRSQFNHPASSQQNSNSFDGKVNELIGFDYDLTLGPFNLYGELARSKNSGAGILAGIFLEIKNLEFIILARNYSKNFNSFHGSSFIERGDHPQNEQGLYSGFQFTPLKHLKLSIYFDQYRFPWRSYFVPMPSRGNDLFIKAEHKPAKNLLLSLKFRSTQKERYCCESNTIVPRSQKNLRFQLNFQPWTTLKLRNRVEKTWVNYQFNKQLQSQFTNHFKGTLLYQDVIFRLHKNFDIAARMTLFDTDSYESRLYQFEHDVPGMLTNQMLYGTGNRWYIKILWKINRAIKLSMKLASTRYHYVTAIGSGADRIPGNDIDA